MLGSLLLVAKGGYRIEVGLAQTDILAELPNIGGQSRYGGASWMYDGTLLHFTLYNSGGHHVPITLQPCLRSTGYPAFRLAGDVESLEVNVRHCATLDYLRIDLALPRSSEGSASGTSTRRSLSKLPEVATGKPNISPSRERNGITLEVSLKMLQESETPAVTPLLTGQIYRSTAGLRQSGGQFPTSIRDQDRSTQGWLKTLPAPSNSEDDFPQAELIVYSDDASRLRPRDSARNHGRSQSIRNSVSSESIPSNASSGQLDNIEVGRTHLASSHKGTTQRKLAGKVLQNYQTAQQETRKTWTFSESWLNERVNNDGTIKRKNPTDRRNQEKARQLGNEMINRLERRRRKGYIDNAAFDEEVRKLDARLEESYNIHPRRLSNNVQRAESSESSRGFEDAYVTSSERGRVHSGESATAARSDNSHNSSYPHGSGLDAVHQPRQASGRLSARVAERGANQHSRLFRPAAIHTKRRRWWPF